MRSMSLTHVVYPPACLLCRQRLQTTDALFCETCEGSLHPVQPPCCQRCGVELVGAYDAQFCCQRCREHPLAFEQACAPFAYLETAREAVQAFKYHGRRRVGLWLAAQMAHRAAYCLPLAELERVVPVPMHWLKARFRGSDPVALLARTVADLLLLPYTPTLLQRTRWTPTQTRLTASQRFRNVREAFHARDPIPSGATALLVDDVLTSGATADACSRALKAAGAARVFVLTAACALPRHP